MHLFYVTSEISIVLQDNILIIVIAFLFSSLLHAIVSNIRYLVTRHKPVRFALQWKSLSTTKTSLDEREDDYTAINLF